MSFVSGLVSTIKAGGDADAFLDANGLALSPAGKDEPTLSAAVEELEGAIPVAASEKLMHYFRSLRQALLNARMAHARH